MVRGYEVVHHVLAAGGMAQQDYLPWWTGGADVGDAFGDLGDIEG